MSFVFHSYELVCHLYITRMYSYVTHMLLVCHPYFTHMYSYVILMSLVCTCMSFVCHSYVLVYHPYVTRLWFYHEPHFCYKRYNLSIFISVNGPSNYNYTGNKFRDMIKIKNINSLNLLTELV